MRNKRWQMVALARSWWVRLGRCAWTVTWLRIWNSSLVGINRQGRLRIMKIYHRIRGLRYWRNKASNTTNQHPFWAQQKTKTKKFKTWPTPVHTPKKPTVIFIFLSQNMQLGSWRFRISRLLILPIIWSRVIRSSRLLGRVIMIIHCIIRTILKVSSNLLRWSSVETLLKTKVKWFQMMKDSIWRNPLIEASI